MNHNKKTKIVATLGPSINSKKLLKEVLEAGLNVLDRELDIEWPLAISEISERDQNHPMIKTSFKGIVV